MTNTDMLEAYYAALHSLEQRHAELTEEIRFYDKRVALLEEEMDELWEVIATLKKHEEGKKYGRREAHLSAGCGGQRIPGILGL